MALVLPALGGCVGKMQEKMIFPASRDMATDPGALGLAFEERWFSVDGHRTHAWYVPLQDHRGVVLFSHGNSGNLSRELASIALLRDFGFSVLAYDYGGYGLSTGRPTEARCYADIHAMWGYLVNERDIPAKEILLFGRSLGAAPTLELARTVQPGAVILESPFLSIRDVARETSMRALSGLVQHRFENKEKIGALTCPVLIIHSPSDDVVPFTHGKALFEQAPEPKTFLEVTGGHHTPLVTADPAYREGWESFLTPIFGVNPVKARSAGN